MGREPIILLTLSGSVFSLDGDGRYCYPAVWSGMSLLPVRIIFFTLMALSLAPTAQAQISDIVYTLDRSSVIVCPESPGATALTVFDARGCETGPASLVDAQGRLIWFKVTVDLPVTKGENGEPLSIYISGKMSSEVYLNGQYVGRNGIPSADAASETPGLMDAEIYIPQTLLKLGRNEIVVRASAHHGYLTLGWPLHTIAIGPSGIHAIGLLPRYIPALVTLGLFIVGILYFGTMAVISADHMRFLVLCVACVCAAAQLVSEALRGFVAYPYPVHDLRVLSIAIFSAGFGLSVAYHVFRQYAQRIAKRVLLGLSVACILILVFIPSFDFKSLVAMTLPLFVALLGAAVWTYQRRRRAFIYFLSVLAFIVTIFVFRGLFLDTLFFFLVAFFLALIFVEQALTLAEEAKERRIEQARADRLSQVLDEVQMRADGIEIKVRSAGRIERINSRDIVHCQSIDGYVEIVLVSGQKLLHSATLNELEDILPSVFLRVHRSHLINLKHVESLSRDKAGTGFLKLSGVADVPVSRRILPKVRQALS